MLSQFKGDVEQVSETHVSYKVSKIVCKIEQKKSAWTPFIIYVLHYKTNSNILLSTFVDLVLQFPNYTPSVYQFLDIKDVDASLLRNPCQLLQDF